MNCSGTLRCWLCSNVCGIADMKVKTAVDRVVTEINRGNYVKANELMHKYRRRFGNRHFTYWIRLYISNGLYYHTENSVPG
jgi:hypothetical protein